MDGLLGNLFGMEEEDPLLAMLPPEQRARLQQQVRGQGMTNLGLALLQAGGPSRTPTGIGSRLGQAGMQAMQANQGLMDRNLERLMAARRMQQEQEQQQRREQFRQAIPSLFTTQTVTPAVVDEQGRPGAGEVRPPVTTGGLDQNAAMRLALQYPDLSKDLFGGISSVREMFKQEKPEYKEVGGALYQITPGQRPELLITPKGKLSGEFANIALGRFGTDVVSDLPEGAWPEIVSEVDRLAKARSNKSVVNVAGQRYETEYEKGLGAAMSKADLSLYETAQKVPANVEKIDTTINQLTKSDARTGVFAETLKNIDRVKAKFLADEKAGKRVADTEILNALLGSEVFPQIGALGIGARGLDTPAEREFLREVIAGTIQMDKNALIRLAQIRRSVEERAAQTYNERLRSGDLDDFFAATRRKKNEIKLPTAPSITPSATGGGLSPAGQRAFEKYRR